jgi:membrane protease YdiL (CAAX protease family)
MLNRPAVPSEPPPPGSRPSKRPSLPPGALARPMSWLQAVGWVFGILAAQLVLTLALLDPGASITPATAIQAAAYLTGLVAILQVHAPESGIRALVGLRPTHLGFLALGALLGLSAHAPVSLVYHLQLVLRERLAGAPPPAPAVLSELTKTAWVAGGFAIVLVAPIVEELLFRGGVFIPVLRSSDKLTALLVTSVLFALAHDLDPTKFLPMLLFGGMLAFLRLESGSVVPGMLAHAAFNATSFLDMVWEAWIKRPSVWTERGYFFAGVSTVALAATLALVGWLGSRSGAAEEARAGDKAR